MTTPVSSHGTVLSYSTDGGTTFVVVAGVTECNRPERRVELRDTTLLSDNSRTRIPVLNDFGPVSFSGKIILGAGSDDMATSIAALIGFAEARLTQQFRVQLPDGTRDTFTGVVESFSPASAAVGSEITYSGSIQPTGPVVTSEAP